MLKILSHNLEKPLSSQPTGSGITITITIKSKKFSDVRGPRSRRLLRYASGSGSFFYVKAAPARGVCVGAARIRHAPPPSLL